MIRLAKRKPVQLTRKSSVFLKSKPHGLLLATHIQDRRGFHSTIYIHHLLILWRFLPTLLSYTRHCHHQTFENSMYPFYAWLNWIVPGSSISSDPSLMIND